MINGHSLANIRTIAGVSLLMTMILMAFVAQWPVVLIAGSVLCAFYALINYSSARIPNDSFLVFLCVFVLFLPALINTHHGLSPAFYFFSTISTFFAARAVTRHPPEVCLAAFRLVYSGAVVGIAVILYTYWGYPEPFGMFIEGSSTNGIPAYLIVIQIGLSLCNYLVRQQLPLLSPVLTGTVAFFGNGRGSLVIAGLIIVVSLCFNLTLVRSTSRRGWLFFIFAFIVIAITLSWYAVELIDLLMSYTKLSVGLEDSNRAEILDQYLGKLDPWTLLVGADYAGTVIEYQYGGNPHIAYIRTHSFFGLPLTVLAMLSPAFVFISKKSLTAKVVFACFIALAAMRAVSEPIFFPTLLDFFCFSYFFLFFRYAPSNRSVRTESILTAGIS